MAFYPSFLNPDSDIAKKTSYLKLKIVKLYSSAAQIVCQFYENFKIIISLEFEDFHCPKFVGKPCLHPISMGGCWVQNWTSILMNVGDISVVSPMDGCSSELGVNWSMGRQNI